MPHLREKAVQIAARARELLSKAREIGRQQLGRDDVGHAEDPAENVVQPLIAIEAEQHARAAADAASSTSSATAAGSAARIQQSEVGVRYRDCRRSRS